MRKPLKYLSLSIVFFIPLMIFAGGSSSSGEENASLNSDITSPIKAKNVKIHPKRTLPSPAHLGEVKSPPSHSNAGGNNSDDGGEDDTDDTSGEGAITGVLGSKGSGEKYAIVIGIADYPGDDLDLKYTDDDAREVKENLIDVYGYDKDNVVTLIDDEATYENIKDEVNGLSLDVDDENDEVVFFFSGHGGSGDIYGETHQSIWVHNETETVPLYDVELKEWFSDIKTDRIVFGFDSCLSGGMNDLAGGGRIVVTASTETGTAYEFDNLQNGQFTYYFFEEGIRGGLADTYDHDDDNAVGQSDDVVIEEAYEYTKDSYSPRYKRQGPAIFDGFENDLLLGY